MKFYKTVNLWIIYYFDLQDRQVSISYKYYAKTNKPPITNCSLNNQSPVATK